MTTDPEDQAIGRYGRQEVITKLVGQIGGLFVGFALALFIPADTLAWPAGWLFLGLFFGFVVFISGWLLRHNTELLEERMGGIDQAGQEDWDRSFQRLMGVLFLAWLILMPLDAVRFHWTRLPAWLAAAGAMLLLCSFSLFSWTFRENTYLSPVVRIQAERNQTVISTGPYRYIRHPLYAGFALFVPGSALLLGSGYGLPAGLLLIVLVAVRAVREEHTLQKALPGYAEYMTQVKHRLIPYVW